MSQLNPFQEAQIKTFKALADGTRMRMISMLSKPMTVKQLADHMGEDHHKLYHHMRVLEGAGIVKLVETRTDSHIVEKYYQLLENSLTLDSKQYAQEYFPVLNSMVMELAQNSMNDLIQTSTASRERAAASRIMVSCRPDQFEQLRALVQKHIHLLLGEVAAIEDTSAETAYEILALHFPVTEALVEGFTIAPEALASTSSNGNGQKVGQA
ncbi:MAG: helix-turn-helix domain-containing protein [bacterium]